MDVILEILRWTSLVAIAVVALIVLLAPLFLFMEGDATRWLLCYVVVIPLTIGAVFLIMGLSHTYWPDSTNGSEHCGEGTQYVTYEHTTYVLSGKVLVPVTSTEWQCIADGAAQ